MHQFIDNYFHSFHLHPPPRPVLGSMYSTWVPHASLFCKSLTFYMDNSVYLRSEACMFNCTASVMVHIVSLFFIFLEFSVADPDPGSGAFLPQGSGIRFDFFPDPGSRILDPYRVLKFNLY
jgi:hypothetical protein